MNRTIVPPPLVVQVTRVTAHRPSGEDRDQLCHRIRDNHFLACSILIYAVQMALVPLTHAT